MPVALPPGRAKLTTRPRATGPLVTPNTIGMFVVAAFAARAEPDHRHRRLLRARRERPAAAPPSSVMNSRRPMKAVI